MMFAIDCRRAAFIGFGFFVGASGQGCSPGKDGSSNTDPSDSGQTSSDASGSDGSTGLGGSSTAGTGNAGRGASVGGLGGSGGSVATGGSGTGGGAGGGSSMGGRSGATGGASGGANDTGGASGTADEVIWPNEMSRANSDPWLVQNHDRITQLRPKVLVINLEPEPASQAKIDQHIAALKEASSFHKYKDPSAQPALAYELLKVVNAQKGSRIDYDSWNTQDFADSVLQVKDPDDPSGPNLTLCELFERGVVHEVWCMADSDPKCGETQEAKQVYNNDGTKVPDRFANVSNGASITSLSCDVTVRITDFNSGRGAGCHQHAMGHAWERYMDSNSIPMLGKQARRFLNWDLDSRLGAPFKSFYSACISNGTQLTDCMVWESQIRVRSGPTASRSFDIADMSGGCGNAHFYANTTGTYSYDANMPDPTVLTSCENYGLHNGPDGKDLTTPYTNAMTDEYYGRSQRTCPPDQPACDDDCGGHGTTYLYQNFPGPGTVAKNDDGTPMQNWWVYLFY